MSSVEIVVLKTRLKTLQSPFLIRFVSSSSDS